MRRLLALLASIVPLAVACGALPLGGLADQSGPRRAADFVQVVHAAPPDDAHIDRRWRLRADNVLVTPHSVVTIAWVGVTERLDAGAAAALHAHEGDRAADGHELVLAGLALSSLAPPCDEHAAAPSATTCAPAGPARTRSRATTRATARRASPTARTAASRAAPDRSSP